MFKSFYDLSNGLRGMTCICVFLVFILGYWNLLRSLRQRRKLTLIFSCCLMVISYPILQVIGDIRYWKEGFTGSEISLFFGKTSAVGWLLFISFLMGMSIILTLSSVKWNKEHLTPMAVKDGMDQLQAGLCYWEDGGKLVLSNRRMDEICEKITGEALLNGEAFQEAISQQECMTMPDGTVQRFLHRKVKFDGRQVHELVATDVTELQKKNEILNQETAALRKMNENLRRYNQNIEETVRRQEILDAKAYVHDEMNRLILVTAALTETEGSPEEYTRIMTLWRNNTTLLSDNAAIKKEEEGYQDLRHLATLLDVKLVMKGMLPETIAEEAREILMMVIREALANAVKHGAAKNVNIDFLCHDDMTEVRISNDGRLPDGELCEGGGISNIRLRVEALGGKLRFETKDVFCMILEIPQAKE